MYISAEQIRQRGEEYGLRTHHTSESLANMSAGEENDWANVERELEQEHMEQVFDWHDQAMRRMIDHGIYEDREEIAWMLLKGMGKLDDECPVDAQYLLFGNWEVTPQLNQWQFDNVEYGGSFFDVDVLEGLKCCEATDKEHELKAQLDPSQIIQLDKIINSTRELAYFRAKRVADRISVGGR